MKMLLPLVYILVLYIAAVLNVINCDDIDIIATSKIHLAQQYYDQALICDINSDYTCSINYYKEGIILYKIFLIY